MNQLIRCLRRRADLDPAQFRQHWEHPDYRVLIEELCIIALADGHSIATTLRLSINAAMMERHGSRSPYDGVMEVNWENRVDFNALTSSDDWNDLYTQLLDREAEFVDHSESTFFFVNDD